MFIYPQTKFNFIRDKDLEYPFKPLYLVSASVAVPINNSHEIDKNGHDLKHGCLTDGFGESFESVGGKKAYTNQEGVDLSRHWYVQPGKHEFKFVIDHKHRKKGGAFHVPFDTTVHVIVTHLHPYGKYLELIDITTGKRVYKAKTKSYRNRRGIKLIDQYVSKKGIPIYKDHEYELRAVYDNTTDGPIDAMAVIYLYAHDKGFYEK